MESPGDWILGRDAGMEHPEGKVTTCPVLRSLVLLILPISKDPGSLSQCLVLATPEPGQVCLFIALFILQGFERSKESVMLQDKHSGQRACPYPF